MYRVFRHLLYLTLAALLQTTWVHHIQIFEIQPDLILLALVLIGATAGHIEATIFGFGVGLFQDTYTPADLGLNAFTKSIISFAIGMGRSGVMIDTAHVRLLLVFGAVLVHDLIYYIGHSDIAWAQVHYHWVRYGIGRALYSGAIASILISIFQMRRRYIDD